MAETQAKAAAATSNFWGLAQRMALILVVTLTLGGSVLRASQTVGTNVAPVGFFHGIFHGALMPCTMPALLLGRDMMIYAPNNNGHPYKLGYTVGVNGCGLLFFGVLFWRLNRFRKRKNGKF